MPRLLVIDDRDQTIEMCHRHLRSSITSRAAGGGIPARSAKNGTRAAPSSARTTPTRQRRLGAGRDAPDLVVLDLHFALPEAQLLPRDKDGLDLETVRRTQGLYILEQLRKDYPTLPVVLLTATDASIERPQHPLVHFCENEVVDSRPWPPRSRAPWRCSTRRRKGRCSGTLGAMAELRRQIAVLARSPLPVLIEGETGTGKSFLAEHVLHPRSGRRAAGRHRISRPSRRR